MLEILIPIEITEQEAQVFRIMREAGVFNLKNGSATLNFTKTGMLRSIKTELMTYSQGEA